MSIIAKDLGLTYQPDSARPVRALREVSFQIDPGERVAIIGRSGSGKTSLLRLIAGLLAPSAGSLEVCDHDLSKERPTRAFYARVGVMFQDYGLVKQLTPLTNILCGTLHGEAAASNLLAIRDQDARERAHSLLSTIGLQDRAHTTSAKLSGGEQQRVGLCRLLMQAPKVMLLDEPIASLDVHWAEVALEMLGAPPHEESTAIVILHDLEMAKKWATRVLLIEDGRLAFDGDPRQGCAMLEASGSSTPSEESTAQNEGEEEVTPGDAPSIEPLPGAAKPLFYGGLFLGALALYGWALWGLNLSASKIFGSFDKATGFLGRMLPPDPGVVGTVFDALLETIQMALIGTTFAALFALPIAVAAARNVSPVPVRFVARLMLNFMRTVPSIIWGLFFVAIVGLGPFPGVLALTFYATGYLGKFFYEGIESIDPRPLTALGTTGASRLHVFRYGVFPQVLPLLASYTIYMFEYNVRAASILGVVGAGGVGFYLYSYINNFTYTKAATALLMLLVLVTVIDWASGKVRERLNV